MKFILILILLLIILSLSNSDNIENFLLMPWNNSTRFYPTYDIRGYPYIYQNYPPKMYLTPYNYTASGNYIIDLITH